ncbi:uncharacterized protein LOC123301391 [Chrysoperla carnea]|uniref:uncharacterized protein LOC123301391 n=1 Tax=Chrysoperla carnea TaxID=189513 RepID=UPI001D084C73|nr:uncharacterized protein LOC123301391 [Chrysoperla carnea]
MNGIDSFGSPLFKNYQDSYTSHNESILQCNVGNNCFDAKQRRIVNVGKPINKQDVVNLESLGQCLSLDDKESYFDAKNKKISNVASPEFSTDAVDLYTLINHYNNSYHRTIRMKPSQVNQQNEKRVLNDSYNHIKVVGPKQKFTVGDHERISKFRTAFARGFHPSWTPEIFTVREVKLTNP